MIPLELHKFFWDCQVKEMDDDKYWFFIIERLLEHGNDIAVNWLMRHYTHEKIIKVVKSSRTLSRKTANFWKNFFQLGEEDVLCLQKSSQSHDRIYWPG